MESDGRKQRRTGQADVGASGRAVSIARVIDRLCRAPGAYQITVVVPAHRRGPWRITYAKLEVVRQDEAGRKGG